jgi:hypothetical protein
MRKMCKIEQLEDGRVFVTTDQGRIEVPNAKLKFNIHNNLVTIHKHIEMKDGRRIPMEDALKEFIINPEGILESRISRTPSIQAQGPHDKLWGGDHPDRKTFSAKEIKIDREKNITLLKVTFD